MQSARRPISCQARSGCLARRPFDKAKATPASGAWDWVNVPQSIMLNGHAFYGDCALLEGANTAVAPKCAVTHQWLPPGRSSVLPFAAANNPGRPSSPT